MMLSELDRRFIERSRGRTHVALYVLPVVLAVLVVAWIALFSWWPLAINPRYAWSYFEGMEIPKGTVTTYAITVSVLVNSLLLVVALWLVTALLWGRRERKYLKLIARLERPQDASPQPNAAPKRL